MALAVVQAGVKDNDATGSSHFAFGVGPTNGNLLIAIVGGDTANGDAIAGTGWTLDQKGSNVGTLTNYSVFYKYAGAGESTGQTPDTRSWNTQYVMFWEISGVSGTFANDHAQTNADMPNDSGQTSDTSTSHNTANANALVLVGAWVDAGAGAIAFTGTPTLTSDAAQNSSTGGFNHATANAHALIASSGTAYQYTATWTGAVVNINAIVTVELKPGVAPTETGTASLGLTKVSFGGAAAREETAAASLALTKVSFHATATREETAAAALALSKVTIAATSVDLGTGGGVHFSTFGA